MQKFARMVAIEPTRLPPEWDQKLRDYAQAAVFYTDIPTGNSEIVGRIGDADCVLLSYTSAIDREVLAACPGVRYIGMCCSLYDPESANVDIRYAAEQGIAVTGVRDYGDAGVAEYVVSELVRLLQGRGGAMWREEPMELTGLAVGILGMGAVGSLVARTLRFFGADIHYHSRTRKPALEAEQGYTFHSLDGLLRRVDILITCLNKNVVLLGGREFDLFGCGKILVNTSIGPAHETPALMRWLERPGNFAICDTAAGLGEAAAEMPNAFCGTHSAGLTSLARQRLAEKVAAQMKAHLEGYGQPT